MAVDSPVGPWGPVDGIAPGPFGPVKEGCPEALGVEDEPGEVNAEAVLLLVLELFWTGVVAEAVLADIAEAILIMICCWIS